MTRRSPKKAPAVRLEQISLNPSLLSVEELEHRMETALIHGSHSAVCNCLGTLCQCDGWDCVEVCASHCLIHYA